MCLKALFATNINRKHFTDTHHPSMGLGIRIPAADGLSEVLARSISPGIICGTAVPVRWLFSLAIIYLSVHNGSSAYKFDAFFY